VFVFLVCKKSCTHLAKGIYQVVCKVLILGVQSQRIQENLKRGGLGTGCRSREPNQDKSLVFAIVIFL